MTEHELGNMIERAYVGFGGAHVIHFIGTTPDGGAGRLRAGQFAHGAGSLPAIWFSASSRPHGGTIPGRCCAGFTVEARADPALSRPACHRGCGL